MTRYTKEELDEALAALEADGTIERTGAETWRYNGLAEALEAELPGRPRPEDDPMDGPRAWDPLMGEPT